MSQIKSIWIQHESINQDFIENEIQLDSGVICKIATNKITDNKLFIIRIFEKIEESVRFKKSADLALLRLFLSIKFEFTEPENSKLFFKRLLVL